MTKSSNGKKPYQKLWIEDGESVEITGLRALTMNTGNHAIPLETRLNPNVNYDQQITLDKVSIQLANRRTVVAEEVVVFPTAITFPGTHDKGILVYAGEARNISTKSDWQPLAIEQRLLLWADKHYPIVFLECNIHQERIVTDTKEEYPHSETYTFIFVSPCFLEEQDGSFDAWISLTEENKWDINTALNVSLHAEYENHQEAIEAAKCLRNEHPVRNIWLILPGHRVDNVKLDDSMDLEIVLHNTED